MSSSEDSDHESVATEDSGSEVNDQIEYIEEDSESEPELECDIWDEDCIVLTNKKSNIIGYHLMPTCTSQQENPAKKIKLFPQINQTLTSQQFTQKFIEYWNENKELSINNLDIFVDPFKICVFNHFLANETLLEKVREEFNVIEWNERNMDLYEFFQSKDLKHLFSDNIKMVYEFLKTDVMPWVSKITGFDLVDISATCSLYSNTDYLLVHDDQRGDRMVAFVLYLTTPDGWDQQKGGALQLLNKDSNGQPLEVVRSILPSNNQMILFPVTSDSYHQVAEVTTLSDCRMSINGWFHTKVAPKFTTPLYKTPTSGLFSKRTHNADSFDIDLESWINKDYLLNKNIKKIQAYIEENSEISLKDYLKLDAFEEIKQNLDTSDLKWVKCGPPNRYNYEKLLETNLSYTLERLINLFKSKQMFDLLQKYTDLELTSKNASMRYELQRWTPGSYSLLTDYDWHHKNELDLILYFGCKAQNVIGARTQYIALEDEIQQALITVEPDENNLNIVFRDTARFTKYFSKQSKCECFYSLVCSYSE